MSPALVLRELHQPLLKGLGHLRDWEDEEKHRDKHGDQVSTMSIQVLQLQWHGEHLRSRDNEARSHENSGAQRDSGQRTAGLAKPVRHHLFGSSYGR